MFKITPNCCWAAHCVQRFYISVLTDFPMIDSMVPTMNTRASGLSLSSKA